MPAAGEADRSARFLRVLGDELRLARRSRGWRRRDLCERLGRSLSVQAIATYEQGTRACTVVRLLQLTEGLGESMPDLLDRVLERMPDIRPSVIIDLVAVAATERAELRPLRRWAQARLRHTNSGESTLVRLDQVGIESLAEVCGMDSVELVQQLSTVDPCSD